MRMKRFSSALCLAEQAPKFANQNPQRATIRVQVEQQSSKKSAKQAAKTRDQSALLVPDDPMILARQRRPSASNQGSINVDQQGEFNCFYSQLASHQAGYIWLPNFCANIQ